MTDSRSDPRPPRSPVTLGILAILGVLVFAALIALGIWQIHRLAWKEKLIATVQQRVTAPPVAPPGPADWSRITADSDGYRHVRVRGRFLYDKDALVQAVTERGGGYWVLTPLQTAQGPVVLVNRGFVPADTSARAARRAAEKPGDVDVTGLLRVTEPKGGVLQSNEPEADRWYSRDVAAIAATRGLHDVAPYFIDADATPNPGGLPVGGMTVIAFPNNHLVYIITWFGLALMLLVGAGVVIRHELQLRRPR